MTKFNASEDLKDMTPGSLGWQPFGMIFQFFQNCMVHIFKDQIKLSSFTEHFNQIDKIFMT